MKLTKRDIETARYERTDGGRCVLWDSLLPGFGLRIYPSGRRAFILSYRAAGRKRMMTIGTYGVLTLDQGRDIARQKLAAVIGGADPLAEKQKAARGATMKTLCADYIERHAKPFKKSWEADELRLNRQIVPVWGARQVISITRADVADLFHDIGKTKAHYEANRVIAVLGKMFECAIAWGYLPDNAANPARKIKKYPERKRDRWVTPEEMPKLAAAINGEPNVYIRSAFWLYLFTGLRRGELLNLKREQIDWTRAEISLPDTKAGRPFTAPLSGPAMAILRGIPEEEGNPYLFPGRRTERPLVELKMAWQRIRIAAGVPDVRIHDLRRTVGSWLAQAGNSLHLIGRVLNHSNPTSTAIYARFANDTVRQALEEHGRRLLAASEEPAGKVIEMRQVTK
jgi:integrase